MFFPLPNYLVENLSTRSNKAHYLVIDLVENKFTENKISCSYHGYKIS